MPWVYLLLAGFLETAWAVGLKFSGGFTRLWPTVFTLTTMAGSIWLLALALKHLPLGTAYAVWTGIGAAGTVVLGILFLGEPKTAARIICLGLILIGIVGLRLVSSE